MGSRAATVEFVVGQLGDGVRAKAMFGEYGVYRGDVLIALLCDDRLFMKPTSAGRALIGEPVEEGSPYPGAKPSLVVPEERWDDTDFMSELAAVTAAELAKAPPKKPRTPRR